ncbi:uncharacterized protein BO88DRAFT_406756 [Aspergillus vadensis CBS 113365]|uniref:Uncharacterized protein n=1 Tax=Aspergillus vadensis (strain CBS 113365 / IMI 142717 / IBT 24658) TaxID=1448311 RepID=A0A319B0X0_ASPVC|nr:hypothetical protein BO88DRAFT_406756 [Aspergillus vadensis CBS 113365]PYH66286.1 hypothetical protein BO88DRAFT_406756 [Aspergillus vadensis CBS 113365]
MTSRAPGLSTNGRSSFSKQSPSATDISQNRRHSIAAPNFVSSSEFRPSRKWGWV